MKLGFELPRRKKLLSDLQEAGSKRTYPLKLGGRVQDLPMFQVPLEMSKYRLRNGRTLAAQKEYLAQHKDAPRDLFTKDDESDEAQRAQHEILKTMASEKGLIRLLKSEPQTQPLILTDRGFALNGNRRLCAIRELHHGDPKSFGHFAEIDIVVLPPMDEASLIKLEAELQIHEDVKAPYSWMTKAMMMKGLQDEGKLSDDDIAAIYKMKVPEVRESISMLAAADDYLRSRGLENEYGNVADDEFAFLALIQSRAKLVPEGDKDLLAAVTYCVLDDESRRMGNVYRVIPRIGKSIKRIEQELVKQLDIGTADDTNVKDPTGLLGATQTVPKELIRALGEEDNLWLTLDAVQDVVEAAQVEEKDKKKAKSVLKLVGEANTKLQSALSVWCKTTDISGVAQQLDGVESAADTLREKLDD